MSRQPDIAFALAGLGGFNAHGAGFLAAATRAGVEPELVTATSGQVLVLAEWLGGKSDLRKYIVDRRREADPLAQLQTAILGLPGVFHPAYMEAFTRFWQPPASTDSLFDYLADRYLPAQEYVPERGEAYFEQTAQVLDAATIGRKPVGVVFNAYDLATGSGVLFGNERARELLPDEGNLPPVALSSDARLQSTAGAGRTIQPITAEAVKAALWLSLYGFEGLPSGRMDGAYHRPCLVAELHGFRRIFVARPLANGWLGARRPGNWFEVQDWQCEMWFSAAYKAEVDALIRINQLIDAGHLTDPRYTKVDLVEIAPDTPAGYFNYFVERGMVYDAAYEEALAAFKAARILP